MRVLDHQPQLWFLFEEGGTLFLEVNCSHSFFGYTFLMQLNTGEVMEYRQQGGAYLDWLARDVQDSAPILQVSQSPYKGRQVSPDCAEKVRQAAEAWRAGTEKGPA